MRERDQRNKGKIIWMCVMTILMILVFLAFYRYQKMSGQWMKSVEDTRQLQEAYEELLQENQEKIQELEEQIDNK
ncbi:MAG: hypothetical protein EOM40_00375 [Clostridia bacterium]|nr:hypothetical protein [Clostridia bacterium]NCC44465.1 hypothetical protein [Clostridia bacterium]